MTTDQLKQQLLDLGKPQEWAELKIHELQKILNEAKSVDDKKRVRVLDEDPVCAILCKLLSYQKIGLKSAAERRAENRILRSSGHRKNRETGKLHYFRPLHLPVTRGTDPRTDLKSELMYYFIYWDSGPRMKHLKKLESIHTKEERENFFKNTPPTCDHKARLISRLQAARSVAELLILFELEEANSKESKKRLAILIEKENVGHKREGRKTFSQTEILKIIDSGSENACLRKIENEVLAENIFDAYKSWNPRQISGLPKGIYTNKSKLRPDGVRELEFSPLLSFLR